MIASCFAVFLDLLCTIKFCYVIALERKLSTRKAREELVEKGILPKPHFGMAIVKQRKISPLCTPQIGI